MACAARAAPGPARFPLRSVIAAAACIAIRHLVLLRRNRRLPRKQEPAALDPAPEPVLPVAIVDEAVKAVCGRADSAAAAATAAWTPKCSCYDNKYADVYEVFHNDLYSGLPKPVAAAAHGDMDAANELDLSSDDAAESLSLLRTDSWNSTQSGLDTSVDADELDHDQFASCSMLPLSLGANHDDMRANPLFLECTAVEAICNSGASFTSTVDNPCFAAALAEMQAPGPDLIECSLRHSDQHVEADATAAASCQPEAPTGQQQQQQQQQQGGEHTAGAPYAPAPPTPTKPHPGLAVQDDPPLSPHPLAAEPKPACVLSSPRVRPLLASNLASCAPKSSAATSARPPFRPASKHAQPAVAQGDASAAREGRRGKRAANSSSNGGVALDTSLPSFMRPTQTFLASQATSKPPSTQQRAGRTDRTAAAAPAAPRPRWR